MTSIKSTHERLYAMCVEWTKLSEVENRSLFIQLLHAVKTIKLRLCIKFVRDDCTLKNEYSCHSKLLQQFHFHHHSRCCLETLRDWDDDSIVREFNILWHIQLKMRSIQAVHQNMLDCLMTSFAVASRAIHAWHVSQVQISLQFYAFNSDVSCKSAFDLLKIITHLYWLLV